MTFSIRRSRLSLPPARVVDESHYRSRRDFLKQMGLGSIGLAAGWAVASRSLPAAAAEPAKPARHPALRPGVERPEVLARFPAKRSDKHQVAGKLTDEVVAATHNNYYEFTTDKQKVWQLADRFQPDPWSLEVAGLCRKPGKFDLDDLLKIEQEERVYRFRCVEAWAMDVPWTGCELNRLLAKVEPLPEARFVRFVTVNRPEQMPGIKSQAWYPWPYFEALRLDEAMNPLTLLATGIFGRPLPRQHGAPVRVIVPWKYGYKSPKSVVKIELVAQQPKTFWETLQPGEYPFLSNIDPEVPHPRWSQAQETMIGTGEVRPTLKYGGYGEYVAGLYKR